MSNIYTDDLLTKEELLAAAEKAQWTSIDNVLAAFAKDYAQRTGAFLRHLHIEGADLPTADTDGVLAPVVSDAADPEVAEINVKIGRPGVQVARNITATAKAVPATGTINDIGAIKVKVYGTNLAGEEIEEELPAFTANTAGTVEGAFAFATVTKVEIPIHDGTGAQTEIGFGDKIGLPDMLTLKTVQAAYLEGAKESNAPTVTVDADELEKNTIDLNSALNGKDVDVYYWVG